jgi:hypothetical protein
LEKNKIAAIPLADAFARLKSQWVSVGKVSNSAVIRKFESKLSLRETLPIGLLGPWKTNLPPNDFHINVGSSSFLDDK